MKADIKRREKKKFKKERNTLDFLVLIKEIGLSDRSWDLKGTVSRKITGVKSGINR